MVIIPKMMHKMLYTTTLDRRIKFVTFSQSNLVSHSLNPPPSDSSETWEIYLRKQHIKRNPETNPLGTEEEPIAWSDLPIESKLDVLYQVTEWPFNNPTRVRGLMNDDDNYAYWVSVAGTRHTFVSG